MNQIILFFLKDICFFMKLKKNQIINLSLNLNKLLQDKVINKKKGLVYHGMEPLTILVLSRIINIYKIKICNRNQKILQKKIVFRFNHLHEKI